MNLMANEENPREGMEVFFPEEERIRFEKIKERAENLGVWGISFSSTFSSAAECYESVLDIIEEDKEMLDKNAGEFDDSKR